MSPLLITGELALIFLRVSARQISIQLACDCEFVASVTNEAVQLPWRVVLLSCCLRLGYAGLIKSRAARCCSKLVST